MVLGDLGGPGSSSLGQPGAAWGSLGRDAVGPLNN